MAEKKVQKALTIVGIILLVFIVIFASAVTALSLRARRRRALHRATVLQQLPLTSQTSRQSIITSSRGNQQAARKKSIRERERMNLAFGVVEDDEPNEPSMPYNSTVPMPATSSTMTNPYDAIIKGTRDPFQDPALFQMADRTRTHRREKRSEGGRVMHGERAMRHGTTKGSTGDPFGSPPPKRPSPTKASPSPSRTAKAKYQSTSSPIKPQRALPTSSKEQIGTIHPYHIPPTSRTGETLAATAKSGMKQSTSDRSLNAGYF